jgi:hypothetical protein
LSIKTKMISYRAIKAQGRPNISLQKFEVKASGEFLSGTATPITKLSIFPALLARFVTIPKAPSL